MIKSRKLAYDGRGNAVAKSAEELSSAIFGEIYLICNLFISGPFSILKVRYINNSMQYDSQSNLCNCCKWSHNFFRTTCGSGDWNLSPFG